jgi:hypothetical protein
MTRSLPLEFPGVCYHVVNRELLLSKLVVLAEQFQVRISVGSR